MYVEEQALYHYGILGMKWGIRRTPEQLGRHTIPKGTTPPKKRISEMTEEEISERKKAILASGSAKLLYDNTDLFSSEELGKAYVRLNTENNIKKLADSEVQRGKKKIDKYLSYAKTGLDVYDTTKKVYSAVKEMEKWTNEKGSK